MEVQELKKIKVAKYKCQRSLLFHTRYFFKQQFNKKFVIGLHHEIICNALERVLHGKCTRLIINIAPRYGKTEIAVKQFVTHGLSINPAAKFIHLSYADKLALDNSMAIKDTVNSDAYAQMFPDVRIKKDAKATDRWYTTAGGGMLARAAGGQVTGFGAGAVDDPDAEYKLLEEFMPTAGKEKFNGAIIIDDPIKPEDADSEVERENVNSRFDSTIKNRVNSRNTPIIIIMQRLHPNDLAGYVQREDEEDEWEVISLPCINEVNNRFGLVPGEALWPHKHTVEELLKLKKANDVVYERQYNQNPKPKHGLMFPIQDLHFYDPLEMQQALDDPDFVYLPADPAGEGGDYFSAHAAVLLGNKIYVTEVLYNQDGTDVNEPAVVNIVLREKVKAVGIEGVFGWAETARRIKEELEDKGYEEEVRTLRPRTGKHSRINSRSAFIRNHFYFRQDYNSFPQYQKFMENLTSYLKIQAPGLKNKNDDAPDNLEMAASYYERNFTHVDWFGIEIKR